MNYAQSILWLILSALCLAQCMAKLRKPAAYTPVNFSYENTLGLRVEDVNGTEPQIWTMGPSDIHVTFSHKESGDPFEYTFKALTAYVVQVDQRTGEIKINGDVVRKGKTNP